MSIAGLGLDGGEEWMVLVSPEGVALELHQLTPPVTSPSIATTAVASSATELCLLRLHFHISLPKILIDRLCVFRSTSLVSPFSMPERRFLVGGNWKSVSRCCPFIASIPPIVDCISDSPTDTLAPLTDDTRPPCV